MTTGSVNAGLEPCVSLVVLDRNGRQHIVDAVVDTGFNGALALPSATIAALGLRWVTLQQATLADGTSKEFDVFEATVLWQNVPRIIEVDATQSTFLIGTLMLRDQQLVVQFRTGGMVQIEALP